MEHWHQDHDGFAADQNDEQSRHRLEPGMNAEIVVAWPPRLDDRFLLELVLKVSITDSQDGAWAEARILAYDFCTRA